MILTGKPALINSMYSGRRFLTEKGAATKQSYFYELKKQWKKKPLEGEVDVDIIYYYNKDRCPDIDGPIKATLDALTGVVIKDDKQISSLTVLRIIDKKIKEPYTEIRVNQN